MKKFNKMIIVNLTILMTLPLSIMSGKVDEKTDKMKIASITKELSTTKISTNVSASVVAEKVEEVVEEKEIEETPIVEEQSDDKVIEEDITEEEEESSIDVPQVQEEVVEPVVTTPTYPTYTGKQSFYNANCTGCSGVTSTGVDVSDGRLYYNDSTYGNVRIIAAGPEIRKWSIVRINGTVLGDNVLAIVLDRGGNIGENRKFLIDILTNSQEKLSGISKNVTVEVLREGK